MKICHVIWTRFPIVGYGGTERTAYWLGKAQAELGHEVTYLALPGSHLPFARMLPIPDPLTDIDPYIPPGTDIVQLYGTPNFKISVPYLVNISGNGQAGEVFHPNTTFVSRNHAERNGWTEFVHNGVDLSEYPFERQKDSFALFLAKASWKVKNLKGAIKIAQAAGLPLHVAGGRAACWHRGVVSHGMVDGEKKMRLLQKARALLFPVIWPEPFGIAVIEALACGTPAIVTRVGSLPEIVDSSCGVVADSYDELLDGLMTIQKIRPEACRARVETHFNHIKMAKEYLKYYEKILKDGVLREGHPETPKSADPEQKILYKGY
jgi:glycosyltransferase involved in cell wall biosynthesis